MTATTFHSIHPGTLLLACDECGCGVAATEHDRALHAEFHAKDAVVVDLAVEAARQTVIELRSA